MEVEDFEVVRILVLGEKESGKSSLVSRFIDLVFDQKYSQTIAIDVRSKVVEISQSKVKIELWDTSGNPRYTSISKAYIKPSNGIILIVDVTNRKSFEFAKNWLTTIKQEKSEFDPSFINLVSTKIDMNDKQEVTEDECESLAHSWNITHIRTSSKTGVKVNDCIMDLAEKYMTSLNGPVIEGEKSVESEAGPLVQIEDLFAYKIKSALDFISTEEVKNKQAEIEKSGFAIKIGHVRKNWKKRWFALRDNYLYYFENETSPSPKGFILLNGASVYKYQDPEQPGLGFRIAVNNTITKHQDYYVTGLEEQERDSWIETINRAISMGSKIPLPADKVDQDNKLKEMVIVPGYINFKAKGLFKPKIYLSKPIRRTKLKAYSDKILGEDRFLLIDSSEYSARFMVTPSSKDDFLAYLKKKQIPLKTSIPAKIKLDLFNYTYLNSCHQLCSIPLLKIKSAISEGFEKSEVLSSLELDGITIMPHDISALSFAFSFVPTISSFNFSTSQLSKSCLEQLCTILENARGQVHTLNLSGCILDRSCGVALKNIIKSGKYLKHLDLSNNPLGDLVESSLVFEELSKSLNPITTLKMENCWLSDTQVPHLSTFIRKNSTLQTLSIKSNKGISEIGGRELIDAFKSNPSMSSMDVSETSLSPSQQQEITQMSSSSK